MTKKDMLVEDARNLYCPETFTFVRDKDYKEGGFWVSTFCVGDDCMAWKTTTGRTGYCERKK